MLGRTYLYLDISIATFGYVAMNSPSAFGHAKTCGHYTPNLFGLQGQADVDIQGQAHVDIQGQAHVDIGPSPCGHAGPSPGGYTPLQWVSPVAAARTDNEQKPQIRSLKATNTI